MGTNKKLPSLVGKLSTTKVDGIDLAGGLRPSQLVPQPPLTSSARSGKPPTSIELKKLSFGGRDSAVAIKFGSPSSAGKVPQSSSGWTNLLSQTASGGVSDAFGGGLISAIGGLGGFVSSIAHLFGGGKNTPPPLVRFELPNSQAETAEITSNPRASAQGRSGQVTTSSVQGTYTPAPTANVSPNQQQITQAVKQALLNSSSLNDVIAEI